VFVICAAPQRLQAQTTWTVSGSNGYLSAEAVFTLNSGTLTILLTNTSTIDVLVPSDVLTGLFFDTNSGDLAPVSASLNGSTAYYGSINNVGEGWQYKDGIAAQGKNSGISAAGLGLFGAGTRFYTSTDNKALDGVGYGILSAGFNDPQNENKNDLKKAATQGANGGPLFKNSILFTLKAANGFDLDSIFLDSGHNLRPNPVFFQYGSSLGEPSFHGDPVDHDGHPIVGTSPVPEASSLLLLAFGGLPLLALRRKRA
jgi:hypothetical protein